MERPDPLLKGRKWLRADSNGKVHGKTRELFDVPCHPPTYCTPFTYPPTSTRIPGTHHPLLPRPRDKTAAIRGITDSTKLLNASQVKGRTPVTERRCGD
ncbi:hypothetical protein E2C01_081091 [Portunus trituberculatus]|uniref:Uncharacterized protein n=1 Tax=Portunus trituberculatus TaxID=210409 RepID=A0A5B7J054_PORTR|nr:hypothetical protein [Portunus trituberculatus]